jgi:hypothetical protein
MTGRFLLHLGEYHMAAMFATIICDCIRSLSRRLHDMSSTSTMEAPSQDSHRCSTPCFHDVLPPGEVKVDGDTVSFPVERTRVSTVFSFFYYRVLCANVQGCDVFIFFYKNFDIKLYPMMIN